MTIAFPGCITVAVHTARIREALVTLLSCPTHLATALARLAAIAMLLAAVGGTKSCLTEQTRVAWLAVTL